MTRRVRNVVERASAQRVELLVHEPAELLRRSRLRPGAVARQADDPGRLVAQRHGDDAGLGGRVRDEGDADAVARTFANADQMTFEGFDPDAVA